MDDIKEVEWVGGPNDGLRMKVPLSLERINIVKPLSPFAFDKLDEEFGPEPEYRALPIIRKNTGYFIYYPKDWS